MWKQQVEGEEEDLLTMRFEDILEVGDELVRGVLECVEL